MEQCILLIEDDVEWAAFTQARLAEQGYAVQVAANGHQGLVILREWKPDLVILDIMMPDVNGWTICEHIRQESDVPLIFTTALNTERDVVRGLELGADDYLIKPYGPSQLLARIRAVLRRRSPKKNHVYINGAFEADLKTRQVLVNRQPIKLTRIEFKLLTVLIENEGQAIEHEVFLDRVWGSADKSRRQCLKLYISYLRRKIEPDPHHPQLILTERGIGYRLAKRGSNHE